MISEDAQTEPANPDEIRSNIKATGLRQEKDLSVEEQIVILRERIKYLERRIERQSLCLQALLNHEHDSLGKPTILLSKVSVTGEF